MQVHEAGGPDKNGQACPCGDQSGPSSRTCNSTYMQGCLWPRGLLPCVPAYSGSIGLAMPQQGLAPPPPRPWEGQSIPRIPPPRPSDCLVLQLFLPRVPGDPLAAFSWEPRPQIRPHSRLRPPPPKNVLLLPWQPALCTCLPPAQPHRPLSAFPLSPPSGFLGTACCAVSACL